MEEEHIITESGVTALYRITDRTHCGIKMLVVNMPGFVNPELIKNVGPDCPVASYDMFGNGRSHTEREVTPDLLADQLHEMLTERFRNSDVILVCAGWGGMIACLCIRKYGLGNVKEIALLWPLIDTTDAERANAERVSRLPPEIADTIREGQRTGFRGEAYALACRAFRMERYRHLAHDWGLDRMFGSRPEFYRRMWGDDEISCTGLLKDVSVKDVLRSLTVPVLYITGDIDTHSRKDVIGYCSGVKDLEFHVMEGYRYAQELWAGCAPVLKHFFDRTVPFDEGFEEPPTEKSCRMQLYGSLHDTPGHLAALADKMSLAEACCEAEMYETGAGRPQSYLSAAILYCRCA